MRSDFRVFLDACTLANFGVCDLLLRLSERPRLIIPKWNAEVLAETRRTQVNKLGWPPNLADSFHDQLLQAFPDAMVSGYEGLVPQLTNQEKDRHVLAAALRGNCPLILTFNLRHFPSAALEPWSVQASHPQDFLVTLYELEPKQVLACLGGIAGRRGLAIEDVVLRLGKVLPVFARRVLGDLGG